MKDYDPGLVTLIIGPYTIVGFHSGTFIKAGRNNPNWKHEKGGQGEGVRSRSRDKSGKIVFTLQSTSPSNDDMQTLTMVDEDPNAKPKPVGCMLKYGGPGDDGHVIWSGKDAWLEKPADSEFADEHSPREYTLMIDEMTYGR